MQVQCRIDHIFQVEGYELLSESGGMRQEVRVEHLRKLVQEHWPAGYALLFNTGFELFQCVMLAFLASSFPPALDFLGSYQPLSKHNIVSVVVLLTFYHVPFGV